MPILFCFLRVKLPPTWDVLYDRENTDPSKHARLLIPRICDSALCCQGELRLQME